MNDFTRKALGGAISGLVSAILIDIHAWSQTPSPFDWSLAIRRWIAGSLAGFAAALGYIDG
jgi:uncharacterized membrane protein YraQ (UPF0718 family)